MGFTKATPQGRKLRSSIQGPSGSGKTTTALRIAAGIIERVGGRIALIDGEDGRARLSSKRFDFDISELADFSPESYTREINAAGKAGYSVLIIDSASKEWQTLLSEKDNLPDKEQFGAWGTVLNPKHDAFNRAWQTSPCHVILTLRTKTKYEIQQVERNGRTVNKPVKLGMEPIARPEHEYEFDLAFELDHKSNCWINKRPRELFASLEGSRWKNPGEEVGHKIADMLTAQAAPPPPPPAPTPPPDPPKVENKLEERARIREELLTLEVLFGGRARLLQVIGRPWPKDLGQARECLRLAKEAHQAALNATLTDAEIPFDVDEEAAQPGANLSRPEPTVPAPPPIHAVETKAPSTSEAPNPGPSANKAPEAAPKKPANGTAKTATDAARKKATASYVPLKDLWPILQRLGVTKEELVEDLELYNKTELGRLTPEEREHYLDQRRIRALPRVEDLRQHSGIARDELRAFCESAFEGVDDPAELSPRDLGDLLRHLGMSGLHATVHAAVEAHRKDLAEDVPF